jgi:hypothetical protein
VRNDNVKAHGAERRSVPRDLDYVGQRFGPATRQDAPDIESVVLVDRRLLESGS